MVDEGNAARFRRAVKLEYLDGIVLIQYLARHVKRCLRSDRPIATEVEAVHEYDSLREFPHIDEGIDSGLRVEFTAPEGRGVGAVFFGR